MQKLSEHQDDQLPLQKSSTSLRFLKSKAEPVNSNEIWLLTLSDLLMLLMIFFVFLLAVPYAKPTLSQAKTPADVESPASAKKESAPAASKTDDTQAVARLEKDLVDALGKRENGRELTVERRPHSLIVTFPEQILFDSGQAQLKTIARPTLEAVAAFIMDHPELSIEVQGHTDDRPIRSSRYPSNWELSADRAVQVARLLVQLGADPVKIATKGLGEFHPIEANTSDDGRLKNRRVEIQFSLFQS